MPQETPKWKEFEEAVGAFVRALDERASVRTDVLLPDRDTGRPRQRDVWVDGLFLGHYPIKVLISCKRYKRRVNQQDLDAFVGEIRSSGAHKGVLYSYSGFTDPALEKALAHGISCCRLFSNEAAEIPKELIVHAYCFAPQIEIKLFLLTGWTGAYRKWRELLSVRVAGDADVTLLDVISEAYLKLEKESHAKGAQAFHNAPRYRQLSVRCLDKEVDEVTLQVGVRWRIYRGDHKAYLVDGSYSETDGIFKGKFSFPVLDVKGPNPGPGWIRVDELPSHDKYLHIVLRGGDVPLSFGEQLADHDLPEMKPVQGALPVD